MNIKGFYAEFPISIMLFSTIEIETGPRQLNVRIRILKIAAQWVHPIYSSNSNLELLLNLFLECLVL